MVFFRRFNQTVDHTAGLCAAWCVGEEPVFAAHHKWLYAAFSTVVAQFQMAVLQIADQIRPLLQQVMDEVEFRNLVGRVGRIKYNLFGNVFLLRMDSSLTEKQYERLLNNDVPEQKLSFDLDENRSHYPALVNDLVRGDIEMTTCHAEATDRNFDALRKMALIIMNDYAAGIDSPLTEMFEEYVTPGQKSTIMKNFPPEKTSNRAERSIKPFVMGRKGWLFSNTPAGAQASAVIYSLIETAKENDLDPYRYLLWVLESAPAMALEGDAWAGMLTPANAPETCKIPKETQPDETNEH